MRYSRLIAKAFVATLVLAANSDVVHAAGVPQVSAASVSWRTAFQTKLDALRRKLAVPGIAAAVILPNGEAVGFASGVEDTDTRKAMRPDVTMLAGSVGKSIVAATIISLAEDRQVSLDQKISVYVGDEPWFSQLPNAKDLTLRVLLTHSSGIPNHAEDPTFDKDWSASPTRVPSHVDLLRYVLNKPPLFPAGQGFYYSDTNYILAGLVIEKITGRSFYDLARERILGPLHLTGIVPSDHRKIPGLADGYIEKKNEFGWPEKMNGQGGALIYDPAIEWTGGGFASTPADLARWVKLYTTGRAMQRAYLDDLFTSVYAASRKDRYGLGMQIVPTAVGKAYAHGGSIPGYLCIAAYFPDLDVSVAVMANKSVDSFPYTWLDDLGPALPSGRSQTDSK